MKRLHFLQIEAAIVFVIYQLILFAVWHESGYPAVFWICFGFTCAAFAAAVGNSIVLGEQMTELKDWIFSYPILKHSVIYVAAQMIVATLFLIFGINGGWVLPFCMQLVLLGIYWMLALSCYQARAVAVRVHKDAREKVKWALTALAEAKQTVESCEDELVRTVFKKIEETVRFCDPVSDESIKALEQEILSLLNEAQQAVRDADRKEEALAIAEKLSLLLQDRSSRCRVIKYTK